MDLGLRRAGDRALGVAAVRRDVLGAWFALAGLTGCSSIGGFTGAIAGAASGAATTNPAIGVGVGIAVQAATDAAFQKIFRDMQTDEQDRIAALAGDMRVGEQRDWDIHHFLPFTDERGALRIVAATDNALTTCKEVLFSVVGGSKEAPSHQWFVTQTCRQSDGQWRWAAAEPAVGRWGALQ